MIKIALTALVLGSTMMVAQARAEKEPEPLPCILFLCPGGIVVKNTAVTTPATQPTQPVSPAGGKPGIATGGAGQIRK